MSGPVKSVYANRRMAALAGVGFASGLPMVLAGDTLSAWLSSVRIDVTTIGLFSLIGLPYALKFLWAPFLDRYTPPGLARLGRRRGWLAVLQAILAGCLTLLAFSGPNSPDDHLWALAVIGTAIVVLSASQDIVADAYRTDVLERYELGAGAAIFISGYRIAMIVGGALALIIANRMGWPAAYIAMAVLMGMTVIVTVLAPQPAHSQDGPASLTDALVQPFLHFARRGIGAAVFLFAFVLVFRLPDHLATGMTMPLLIKHLNFTTEEVGWIRQMLGFFLTIIGALIGGDIVSRIGIIRSLIVFGVLQCVSNAGFLILAAASKSTWLMAVVIGVESICGGLVAAGFVAFLMSCCDRRFSATQYALLSAGMAAAKSLGGAITGYAVEHMGYGWFFVLTIVAGVPGLAMLPWVRRSCQWSDVCDQQVIDRSQLKTEN